MRKRKNRNFILARIYNTQHINLFVSLNATLIVSLFQITSRPLRHLVYPLAYCFTLMQKYIIRNLRRNSSWYFCKLYSTREGKIIVHVGFFSLPALLRWYFYVLRDDSGATMRGYRSIRTVHPRSKNLNEVSRSIELVRVWITSWT